MTDNLSSKRGYRVLPVSQKSTIEHNVEPLPPPFVPPPAHKSRFFLRLLSFFCFCLRPASARIYLPSPSDLDMVFQPSVCGKKILVLDLDETLVHSSFSKIESADTCLKLTVESQEVSIYVAVRPGVEEFLDATAANYELVIFTASLAIYADPVIDVFDRKKVVSRRMFRESCRVEKGKYVKDLDKLGRDMSQIIIIDVSITQNSSFSFASHPDNGILIKSFFDDKSDRELLNLLPLLAHLALVPDVREVLKAHLNDTPITDKLDKTIADISNCSQSHF